MSKLIDPQEEERAIAHITDGVFMDELSPEGRVRVVKHLCEVYLSDWPGTPPGFTPWGRLREGKEQHFDESSMLQTRVMPIVLRAARHEDDGPTLRGDLLLTDKGVLLFDHYDHPGAVQTYHLKVCTEEQLLSLVTNPHYFGMCIWKLRQGLEKKRERLVRELELTEAKLGILARASSDWRENPF